MKTTVWTFLSGILAVLLLCSCRKAAEAPAAGNTERTEHREHSEHAIHTVLAKEKMKTCFQCDGTGKIKCPECRDGFVDCPGECLKLTHGSWVHMEVAGHPSTDVWQKFEKPGGGWTAYNQGHIGHVIALRNGNWVDTGPCPICHGLGRIPCPECKGSGYINCTVCDGKKVVPESWTAFDNPTLKNRPDHLTLKDGRVLFGKRVFIFGDHTTIQTTNGTVEVNTADIVSESKPDGI